jgi:predicted PurR-regulated permease PerM
MSERAGSGSVGATSGRPASPSSPPGRTAGVAAHAPASSLRPVVVDERLLLPVAGVLAAAGALWMVRGVLVPLLFVAVLTFVGAPVVERVAARGFPRAAGAALFLVGGGVAILGLFALVVPPLVRDLAMVFERAPAALATAATFVEKNLGVTLPRTVGDLTGNASRELLDKLSPVAARGGALVSEGALGLARGAASAAGVLAQTALVPVISFFVLTELPGVMRVVVDVAPPSVRRVGARYAPLLNEALSALIRGQVTVAALMAVAYAVGLLVSGVPAALAIGVLAGAAYLVPFASAAVALALSLAFALLELGGDAGGPIIGAVITCAVVQLLEGYVLTPRIVGGKAGLSPLATLLAVLLGGTAMGFLGVLFALPVGAAVAVVLREELRRASTNDGMTPAVEPAP